MNALLEKRLRPSAAHDSSPDGNWPVLASMSYIKPSLQRPCSYTFEPPIGEPWENSEYDLRKVQIHDARIAAARPSLEREGFELWDAPTTVVNFMNTDEVKSTYYREARELALVATGGRRAYVFDHLVRRREPDHVALSFGKRTANGLAAANGRIHNDYTEESGKRRLSLVITDPAELSEVRRYSIINIWRSIRGPVLDTPLAVCDARSLSVNDLVVCDVKYPHRTGEIYLTSHDAAHRWSYFSQMDRHEALIFKQYDTQISGVSRFTPHAAFDHPDAPAGTPPRESIELRCLVTY
jgi:hypothetical protein